MDPEFEPNDDAYKSFLPLDYAQRIDISRKVVKEFENILSEKKAEVGRSDYIRSLTLVLEQRLNSNINIDNNLFYNSVSDLQDIFSYVNENSDQIEDSQLFDLMFCILFPAKVVTMDKALPPENEYQIKESIAFGARFFKESIDILGLDFIRYLENFLEGIFRVGRPAVRNMGQHSISYESWKEVWKNKDFIHLPFSIFKEVFK